MYLLLDVIKSAVYAFAATLLAMKLYNGATFTLLTINFIAIFAVDMTINYIRNKRKAKL